MRNWRTQVVLAMIFCFGAIGQVAAENEIAVSLGGENFQWKEFDSGSRLLKESGTRYHLGGEWRKDFGSRLLLEVKGSLYFGNVDYDGQTQDGVPAKTTTHYRGAEVGANVAKRFGDVSGVEIFGGGGWDEWRRRLDSGRDINGRAISGSTEDWTTFYLAAGGGAYWTGSSIRVRARAGVKMPILTDEQTDFANVNLEPKGRASPFLRIAADFLSDGGRPIFGVGGYWDHYRFAKSDAERVSDSLFIFQPRSSQDMVGIYITYYLR